MKKLNLTFTTGLVLEAISAGHNYGFQIMEASGLPGGTVYPALRRLEGVGFLESSWEEEEVAEKEGRPPRRFYSMTPEGVGFLSKARERFKGLSMAVGGTPPSSRLGEVLP